MDTASQTIKFNAFDTRRNLPPKTGRKRGELLFLSSFEKAFTQKRPGVGGKQFQLSGYGVADFIWVDIDEGVETGSVPLISAFELKLTNWKRALSQAYRYSYFADKAYVVMPKEQAKAAIDNKQLFRKLQIGLMVFDQEDGTIETIHAPKKSTPRNSLAREKAMDLLQQKLKFRQLLESFDA